MCHNSKHRQSAHQLIMINFCMKLDKDILNRFLSYRQRIKSQNLLFTVSKGHTAKIGNLELGFLCSVCCLMLINISMKFLENILNSFYTIKSQNLLFSLKKCQSSKNRQSRVTVLEFCMSSNVG